MKKKPEQSITVFIATGLALLTLVLFWPIVAHDFVHYDDPLYVTANSHTQAGLIWENVKWSFGNIVGNKTYWHPITWLSHMLDCQLFGVKAGSHHVMSLLFHILNSIVLFLLLKKLTGALWRSAVIAALFAWHPLQVDTVAWIAERKNLLGTLFSLLTILAYTRYTREKSMTNYVLTLFVFALALMSKGPLAVTLPCLLLLLDFWPLGKMLALKSSVSSGPAPTTENLKLKTEHFIRFILEKLPFFVLSAISSWLTIAAHQRLNLIIGGEQLPLLGRIGNAFVSYLLYVSKILWPTNLAVYYPPQNHPTWLQWTAIILIVGISVAAFWFARRAPYVFVGWFWFLGTLVPFAGFVQAGVQSMADRFVYFPIIGFFLGLIWFATEHAQTRLFKNVNSSLAVLLLIGCLVMTRQQLPNWKDTVSLFSHAAKVTENNAIAHINLGSALQEKGQTNAAAKHYRTAMEINPDSQEAHYFLSKILECQGELEEAGQELVRTIEINPNHYDAHNDLGVLLMRIGRLEEAVSEFDLAINSNSHFAEAYYNRGIALGDLAKPDEAIASYLEALKFKPDYADALNNLAALLLKKGDFETAAGYLLKAVTLRPNEAEAHFNLSVALTKLGRRDEARQHYEIAARLRPDLLK